LQESLDQNIMTFWDGIGLKRMAFSTSEDHLQQLAVEGAVSENEHP